MANKKMVRKKDNKKNKRKLFLAILMILFTGIILTASTYAWFTSNRQVTVDNIDVNVATSQGLQISVDAVNWKSIVSSDDIRGASWAGVRNQVPTKSNSLSPVSTAGEIDGTTGFMNMYLGEIKTGTNYDNILVTTKTTEEEGKADSGNFVAFDIFFQVSGSEDLPIYLTANSKVVTLENTVSTGIENSARVAFIEQGNLAAGSLATSIQAERAAATDTPIIWEPNYDVHTASGVKNASDVYGISTSQTGADALPYCGVKDEIPDTANVLLKSTATDYPDYFEDVAPQIRTTQAGISENAYQEVFTLKPGITKMRIYMWIEGQDVDCENNASGGSITFSLQFSTAASKDA